MRTSSILCVAIVLVMFAGSRGNDTNSVTESNQSVEEMMDERTDRASYKHGEVSLGGGHGSKGKKEKKEKKDLMSKILPMMVMPFLISSSMIPLVLTSLKFMLIKSMFVGKIAILLIAINAFWKSENRGGVYSHNINLQKEEKDLYSAHYGYSGDEEYGAYVNRRRSGRR